LLREIIASLRDRTCGGSNEAEGAIATTAATASAKEQAVLGACLLAVGEAAAAVQHLTSAVDLAKAELNTISMVGIENHSRAEAEEEFGEILTRLVQAKRQADSFTTQRQRLQQLQPGNTCLDVDAAGSHSLSSGDNGSNASNSDAMSVPAVPLTMPEPKPVQRIKGSELSYAKFHDEFAMTQTPVIITGVVEQMTAHPWTMERVADVAGERTVTVKKLVRGSVEWARLEEAETTTVADFVHSVLAAEGTRCGSVGGSSGRSGVCGGPTGTAQHRLQQEREGERRYLFDWSLPLYAPELAAELTIPKYFSGDLLQRTELGSKYRDSWPSLFVAPAGLVSELHVDTFGSNFWMALFSGRKRWTFFDRSDVPLLYPSYAHATDPTFDVELGDGSSERPGHYNLDRHPLLALTEPLSCVLEAGELLFVPHGSPHRVENLTASLAVSGNFVDDSNIDAVAKELTIAGYCDPQAVALRDQLLRAAAGAAAAALTDATDAANATAEAAATAPAVNSVKSHAADSGGASDGAGMGCCSGGRCPRDMPFHEFKAQRPFSRFVVGVVAENAKVESTPVLEQGATRVGGRNCSGDTSTGGPTCSQHGVVAVLHCLDCDEPICMECGIAVHSSHAFVPLSEM
jgi:hypothetical protein